MNLIKFLKTYQADIVLAIAVVLVSITAFNLGKISALNRQKMPITITEPAGGKQLTDNGHAQPETVIVASKNSVAKVYHFPWCPGASKIADKNKLTFTDEAAAISAGYTLASNCQK